VGALLAKSTNVVANGHSSNNTEIRGYTWTMVALNNIDIALGRGFTPADEDNGTHDAIIGYDIVDNLLATATPSARRFASTASPTPSSASATARARPSASRRTTGSPCPSPPTSRPTATTTRWTSTPAPTAAEVMERAKDEVRVLMRTRRHNAVGTPDDFEIETNDTFLDIWNQSARLFAWVVLGIASISLVVGGVVIMNIMLVSSPSEPARSACARPSAHASATFSSSSSLRAQPWR
jgi:putative ABC transport system permease protein